MTKFWLLIILGIGLLAVLWGFLRVITPEDTWICQNDGWVMHGHPVAPMPTGPCH